MSPPKVSLTPDNDGFPDCESCQNMRVVRTNVPVGHPNFGQVKPCPDCGEIVTQIRRRRLYHLMQERIDRYSQHIGIAREQTFDNFDLRGIEPQAISVRDAYEAARKFASELRGWLFLYGSCGTGKSHLCAAIVNRVARSDIQYPPLVLSLITPDFLDLLRSGYYENDYEDMLRIVKTVDVLVLDDLGTESAKPWPREKLFQVLNHRYLQRSPTVVSTNKSLSQIRAAAPRIYDRLTDDRLSTVVRVVAPSYRHRKPEIV